MIYDHTIRDHTQGIKYYEKVLLALMLVFAVCQEVIFLPGTAFVFQCINIYFYPFYLLYPACHSSSMIIANSVR